MNTEPKTNVVEAEVLSKLNIYRIVFSVKQSPLNPLRWCLSLECGHDVWVTSKRKPARKTSACEPCLNELKSGLKGRNR